MNELQLICSIANKIHYVDPERLLEELESIGFDNVKDMLECFEECVTRSIEL